MDIFIEKIEDSDSKLVLLTTNQRLAAELKFYVYTLIFIIISVLAITTIDVYWGNLTYASKYYPQSMIYLTIFFVILLIMLASLNIKRYHVTFDRQKNKLLITGRSLFIKKEVDISFDKIQNLFIRKDILNPGALITVELLDKDKYFVNIPFASVETARNAANIICKVTNLNAGRCFIH